MFNTVQEVLLEYKNTGNFWYPYYSALGIEQGFKEGTLEVLIVKTSKNNYDVWNNHPLRKGWQLVYSLEKCNPSTQIRESLASLKRLFEN